MTIFTKKTRSLTDEEKRLWQYVTRHDTKLAQEEVIPPPVGGRLGGGHSCTAAQVSPHPGPPPNGEGEIKPGAYANIDRNTAERFRKGNYPIDATLDLHGMNREKAYHALVSFIGSHHGRGSRCLLVITGKGKTGSGVLRDSLPGWLASPQLSGMILAFDSARPKHGGAGAYYILLRRKR